MNFTLEGRGCKEIDEKLQELWVHLGLSPVCIKMNKNTMLDLISLFFNVQQQEIKDPSYANKYAAVYNIYEAYVPVIVDDSLEDRQVQFVIEFKEKAHEVKVT